MNYKWAIISYCFLLIALTSPYLFNSEVVAPYRPTAEVMAIGNADSDRLENHKFSDEFNSYIPEILANLQGKRSGWLTLWTDQNELGRPVYHISGLSPAYLPSWVISQFTTNPWRFLTTLSLMTCFLAGLFMILFCCEMGMHPWAALISGISLPTSSFFMYWLTFPMFLSVWCWSAGAMWGIARLMRKRDIISWGVLSFSVYSLLMTGYPQMAVFHAYLLFGYGVYLCYVGHKKNPAGLRQFIFYAGTAVVMGLATAAPTYLDLWQMMLESARASPASSFFTTVLPQLTFDLQGIQLFLLSTLPELFGNPINPEFKFTYNGISLTPLLIFFVVVNGCTVFKQTWGWWLAICTCCVLAFVHPIYEFGIQHLGFGFSRSNPLAATLLPISVIAGYGVNQLFQATDQAPIRTAVKIASISLLIITAVSTWFAVDQQIPIAWITMMCTLCSAILLAMQMNKPRPVLLFLVIAIGLGSVSYPLMLRQKPDALSARSHFIDQVAQHLDNGARFAITSSKITALPSNFNAIFNLASVHSYNSLSSQRYHALIKHLGGTMLTYGRWNDSISPDYDSAIFWMSNIGLILSPNRLTENNLNYIGEESGVYLYRTISRMGSSLQVTVAPGSNITDEFNLGDPRILETNKPEMISDQGDQLEFRVESIDSPSILVLSKKFHRNWEAQVLNDNGWINVRSISINGIFEGISIPKRTQRVRLEFKPLVRFSWISNLFWLSLIVLISIRYWQTRRPSPSILE